jgi:hypothetical protein
MGLNAQWSSEVKAAKNATKAIAARGLFGMPASQQMARCKGGEVATV